MGFCLFLVPYCLKVMGAGDVKLISAVGAILGLKGVLCASLLSSLIGGIYSSILLVSFKNNPKERYSHILQQPLPFKDANLVNKKPDLTPQNHFVIPYGVAICLGTLCSILINFDIGKMI